MKPSLFDRLQFGSACIGFALLVRFASPDVHSPQFGYTVAASAAVIGAISILFELFQWFSGR